jgi:hypothetical protein
MIAAPLHAAKEGANKVLKRMKTRLNRTFKTQAVSTVTSDTSEVAAVAQVVRERLLAAGCASEHVSALLHARMRISGVLRAYDAANERQDHVLHLLGAARDLCSPDHCASVMANSCVAAALACEEILRYCEEE